MALLANPALLILDEPTTGLDVTVEAAVLDLIDEIRRNHHTALLYISHNLGLIARVTERVGVMYAGELVEDAPVRELFATPAHPYTRGLLAAIPRTGRDKRSAALAPIAGTVPQPGRTSARLRFRPALHPGRARHLPALTDPTDGRCPGAWGALLCAGRKGCRAVAPDLPTAGDAAADSVLEAKHLSRFYRMRHGTVRALDEMDLEARRGEVVAVVGESGSGKSTFARVLAGLDVASGGTLRFNGQDIARRTVDRRSAEQVAAIQMVFQNPEGTLNPSFSAGWPIARALRKFRLGRRRKEIEARVEELLRLVRLAAVGPTCLAAAAVRWTETARGDRARLCRTAGSVDCG